MVLGNICQENVFSDILERHNAFLAHKNKMAKKSEKWHFSTGLNLWFLSVIWNVLGRHQGCSCRSTITSVEKQSL